jgi:RNA polymerase sigma factor (sigma-70 family)
MLQFNGSTPAPTPVGRMPQNEVMERLVTELKPRMAAVLGRFRIPPAVGEDLMQDVFLQFLRKHAEIDNPKAWLLGALRLECLLYLRRRRSDIVQATDAAILESVADSRRGSADDTVLQHELARVIGRLRPRCQEAIRLRYSLGCTPVEAASRLGCKPPSLDNIVRRCVASLVDLMGDPKEVCA